VFKINIMDTTINKALVTRYNEEIIEKGDMDVLKELLAPDFVNYSALEGMPSDSSGLEYFFSSILHPAFPHLKVNILDMVAEGNKVVTRKELKGSHLGDLFGIAPTGKSIIISVIDILEIKDGKITGHWGENNFATVIKMLSES
jgi:predicted ester cyclase